jgi:hypothetical protein
MAEDKDGLVRINIRISREIKDWMDEYSKKSGLSLSVIGLLALEGYMQQKLSFQKLDQLSKLSNEMEHVKEVVNSLESMQAK